MAVQYWSDVSILDGSIELATQAKNFKASVAVDALDTTPLSVTTGWKTFIGGKRSGSFSVDLMADFADDGQNETLDGYLGTPQAKSFVLGSADGSPAYMLNGVPLSFTPLEGEPGSLATAKISGVSTGVVARGVLLHPTSVARTSSSTGTARQIGAVSATQRVYAALHVLSVSGTSSPTLTVKVQSDTSGFPSATDVITFTAATARTYEWKSAAGAITDDYWRVSYTISGTNPSFVFGVTVGII